MMMRKQGTTFLHRILQKPRQVPRNRDFPAFARVLASVDQGGSRGVTIAKLGLNSSSNPRSSAGFAASPAITTCPDLTASGKEDGFTTMASSGARRHARA